MKKKILFPILAVVLVLAVGVGGFFLGRSVASSGSKPSAHAATATQEDFLAAMAKGITNRLADDTNTDDMDRASIAAYYKKLVQFEWDEIGKFENASFEDETFDALVKAYFNALKLQTLATENYKHDALWTGLWNGGYRARCGLITELYENYGLEISDSDAQIYKSEIQSSDTAPTYSISFGDDDTAEVTTAAPAKPAVIPKEDLAYVAFGNEIQINKYNGIGGNLIIPSEIDGVKVTRIGKDAFKDCKSLTGLTLPDTLTFIGEDAFLRATVDGDCGALVLPASLTEIEYDAFHDTNFSGVIVHCSCKVKFSFMHALEYVVISKSAAPLLDNAFEYTGSDKLKTIIIPNNGTTLKGEGFFSDAQNATVYTPADSPAAKFAAAKFVAVNSKDFEKMYAQYMS